MVILATDSVRLARVVEKAIDAREIASEWLQQYPQVDAIIAANDEMALCPSQAVAAANQQGILIAGFDAVEPALTAIKEGKMAATIDQLPNQQARLPVQLAIRNLEFGETFRPIVVLPEISLIDEENVEDFLPPELRTAVSANGRR